jgi:flavin-dependent dehydrogenase
MVIWDAVVAGGSVAGSTAARELARRGLRVALVDRARFPRAKACGEGLLPHGVEALRQMGVEASGAAVRGIRFISPSGVRAEAEFPAGPGLVVRRERFDAQLFRLAAETPGVTAFEETLYDADRFPARWVVGADGLRSQFHRRPEFSASPPAPRRIGLSTHVRGLEIDRDWVEVLIHQAGEIYLAPSEGDEAMLACLFRATSLPGGASNAERVLRTLSSLEVLRGRGRGVSLSTPVLGVAPLGLRVAAVASGNTVLVGDASGAPDPVTGEGMSLAILSARAAAEAISKGRTEEYERERWRLGAGSDWLGRWMLRATRHPAIADRVVSSLRERPKSFAKLLEISSGRRPAGELSLAEVARLVV